MARKTGSSESSQSNAEASRQAFVSQEDRPEVQLHPDTPLSELRVRDLMTILGGSTAKSLFTEPGVHTKSAVQDAIDRFGLKAILIKEVIKDKIEKLEIPEPPHTPPGGFPGPGPGPDPRLDQVIQAMSGLTAQVSQLTNQVEEMRKKTEG
jgi:hypothetical protein